MNEALKAKRPWSFAKEEDALWIKAIKTKYHVDSVAEWSKKSSYPHGTTVWKSSKWFRLQTNFDLVQFKVKDGSKVLF